MAHRLPGAKIAERVLASVDRFLVLNYSASCGGNDLHSSRGFNSRPVRDTNWTIKIPSAHLWFCKQNGESENGTTCLLAYSDISSLPFSLGATHLRNTTVLHTAEHHRAPVATVSTLTHLTK